MMSRLSRLTKGYDWILIASIFPMLLGGLATMTSFGQSANLLSKQLMWVGIGLLIAFVIGKSDMRFFRDSRYVVLLYGISVALLVFVLLIGKTVKGGTELVYGWCIFISTDRYRQDCSHCHACQIFFT